MGTPPEFKREDPDAGNDPEVGSATTSVELRKLKRQSSPDFQSDLPHRAKKPQRSKSEDLENVSGSPSPTHLELKPQNTNNGSQQMTTGHRPVTSCTHCRQHKIRCNASENFPAPCSRCERMGLHCEIDPQFRPKKGSQLQNLRRDVDELKLKIEYLTRNESLIAKALQGNELGQELTKTLKAIDISKINQLFIKPRQRLLQRPLRKNVLEQKPPERKVSVQTFLAREPHLLQEDPKPSSTSSPNDGHSIRCDTSMKQPYLLNDSAPHKDSLPPVLQMALQRNTSVCETSTDASELNSPANSSISSHSASKKSTHSRLSDEKSGDKDASIANKKSPVVATTNAIPLLPSPYASIDEFVIGDVRISIDKANELHRIFVTKYLPYFPIFSSNSATELYSQSQLLFWTVMLTACLSDPEPSLYMKLSSLIKQLAIETCWIRTPRSTHISQALLILCIWPLPNQKVLDDCSYRFVGLAKSLSYQLGLHRGEFISEFTRTQTSMPDAEKWRTRTWLGIFFAELCWASILGLPPTSQTDFLIENARFGQDEEDSDTSQNHSDKDLKNNQEGTNSEDQSSTGGNTNAKNGSGDQQKQEKSLESDGNKLPRSFRRLICLANFQAKLCKVMGSSVVSVDGLMESRDRASSLAILERELELLDRKLNFEQDTGVQIYHLYVKLMVCCFAFLPGTPTEDQSQYVTEAYLGATKIVTLLTSLLETRQLIELPIYIRHSTTFAALILFKLQLTPLLLNKYLDSARQSIVTVHRVYRNQLSAWATAVENDISRTASVLEKLNFVLITHPTVFVEEDGIISRMRSHLTDSLFYDLVWCIHEARRREMDPKYNEEALAKASSKRKTNGDDFLPTTDRKLHPLPFYNQISKEDFETIIQTTPNGTTVTKLVPTKTALKNARQLAKANKDSDGAIVEINGIPLSMLDETGSVNLESIPNYVNRQAFTVGLDKPAQPVGSSNFPSTLQVANKTPLGSTEPISQQPSPSVVPRNAESDNEESRATSFDIAAVKVAKDNMSMQRSSSTSAAHVPHRVDSGITSMKPHSNSLFVMNNSLASNLTLNRSIPQSQRPSQSAAARSTSLSEATARGPNSDSFTNLSMFLQSASPNFNPAETAHVGSGNNSVNRPAIGQLSDLETFFQQQSTGWIEGNSVNDDFLGWFDMNMEPEF